MCNFNYYDPNTKKKLYVNCLSITVTNCNQRCLFEIIQVNLIITTYEYNCNSCIYSSVVVLSWD